MVGWTIVFAALGASGPAAGEARPAAFARRPEAVRAAGGVKITFAAASPTDAEVAVVNAAGRVVRRLGAAVLGAKDPPPPFGPGLRQELTWDRTDDAGEPVPAGRCTVRVRLGMRAAFDRFLGREGRPNLAPWMVVGIAVGRDGTVFVLLNDMFWTQCQTRICAFSRDGQYLRTVLPYGATADANKLPGVDFLRREPNRLVPRIHCHLCGHVVPHTRGLRPQTPAVTSDGRLVLVSGYAGENFGWGPRCLLMIDRDGTIPRERIDGPALAEGCVGGSASVALAPGEKAAYVTGLQGGKHGLAKKAHHVVYKVGLGVDDRPSVFVGERGVPGDDAAHLNLPRGIATDPEGNVYVADTGNDRIAVFTPAGKPLCQVPIESPNYVLVSPRSRAVYVACGRRKPKVPGRIVKLSPLPKPEVVWQWTQGVLEDVVPGLDAQASEPIVYYGSPRGLDRGVRRLIDAGRTCRDAGELPGMRAKGDLAWYAHVFGLRGDKLYVRFDRRSFVVDGLTGRRERFWAGYYDKATLGRDGLVYVARPAGWLRKGAIERFDCDKKPVPFAATGAKSEPYYYFWLARKDDVWVTPAGEVYVLELGREPKERDFGNTGEAVVSVIGPDGTFRKRRLIATLPAPVGVRVDSRRNVYVAVNLKPPGRYYPDEIARAIDGWTGGEALGPRAEYAALYGSILKFGPAGGTVRQVEPGRPRGDGRVLAEWQGKRSFAVTGLKGCWLGISPIPPSRAVLHNCFCSVASFDLDGYDRLFVPDAARFCVHVLDASFRRILTFGGYDGIDSAGGKANAPGPAIPLACYRDMEVRASDEACYVLDRPSQRIVRVRLTWREQATCEIRP